jgi:hypothetical protein
MVKKNLKTEGQECNTLKKLNTVYHGRRVNYRKKREKKNCRKKTFPKFFQPNSVEFCSKLFTYNSLKLDPDTLKDHNISTIIKYLWGGIHGIVYYREKQKKRPVFSEPPSQHISSNKTKNDPKFYSPNFIIGLKTRSEYISRLVIGTNQDLSKISKASPLVS